MDSESEDVEIMGYFDPEEKRIVIYEGLVDADG